MVFNVRGQMSGQVLKPKNKKTCFPKRSRLLKKPSVEGMAKAPPGGVATGIESEKDRKGLNRHHRTITTEIIRTG
jgi:hypothetical protein